MRWMLNLDGGPRRVNHAAVAVGDKIYSFGGYSANEALDSQGDFIDVHVLNTFTYRWERLPVFPEPDTTKEMRALTKQRSVTISSPGGIGGSGGGPSTSGGGDNEYQHQAATSATTRRRARSLSDLHPLAQLRATNPPLNSPNGDQHDDLLLNVVQQQRQQQQQANNNSAPNSNSMLLSGNANLRCRRQHSQQPQQQHQRPPIRERVIVEDEESEEQEGEEQQGRPARDANARQRIRELFERIDDDLAEMGSDEESDEDYEEEDEESNSLITEDLDSEDGGTEYMETDEESDVEMIEFAGPEQLDDDEDDENPVVDLVLLAKLHQHPEIPFKRYGHTVVAHKGFIYLWGGRNDKLGCNQTLHRYDPAGNRWYIVATEGQCPPARDGHTAVVEGDSMYIFGGFEEKEHRFSQEAYALHFPSRTWKKLKIQGDPPQYRDFHAACILNGKMYVFGGRSDEMGQLHTSHDVYCDKLHCLDLKQLKWDQLDVKLPAPCGRRSHTMWTYQGSIYLFGGFQSIRNVHFNDLWRFDPNCNRWTQIAPSGQGPSPRRRQCTVLVGSRVFLFGGTMPSVGRRNTLSDLGDLYVLDFAPSLASLCSQAILKYGLQSHAAELLPAILTKELYYMSTPNRITKSHMPPPPDKMIRG